jgi:tetratricopeptide (TPR) repeat protein
MKNYTHYVRILITGIFFVMVFFCNGCSVFSFIGDSLSQGYENMVSYFNAYYNAKRLFTEAEDEIKTAEVQARGKPVPVGQAQQIPATAKQKLGQVIDKCSNILAFHPASSLVDNALLLIGKSFYYQADYLKAERKFAEMLSQYPTSSLALEAQLWYARSAEKLGKWDDGFRLASETVEFAKNRHERDIESQAHRVLANLYRKTDQPEKAIAEYDTVVSIAPDDYIKGEAQIGAGDIYFSSGQYKNAAEAYLQTEKYTSDIYFNYYSKLQAAVAYRHLGEKKKGLELIDAMIDDFRNREYMASILYEQGNAYAESGRREDAIDTYIRVDTGYARTEYSVRSAYQLELIYEKELGRYDLALKYDSVVNAASGLDIVPEGRRKFTALTNYFSAWRQLCKADSLTQVLKDTLVKLRRDSLQAFYADSIQKPFTDSLHVAATDSLDELENKALPAVAADPSGRKGRRLSALLAKMDSIKSNKPVSDTVGKTPAKVVNKPALPSADSLLTLKSLAAQLLGDIFYSDIVVPDSAYFWYNSALEWSYNNSRSPRILFILAELSRTNPEKKYPTPEEYYGRLDHDFPESSFAGEARRFLQKTTGLTTDTAAEYYTQSEKLLDAEEYDKAIGTLRSLVRLFPQSPLAAKGEYAIGWIMEYKLGQSDSARTQYKRVAKKYTGTAYANAAMRRFVEEQPADSTKKDTLKVGTTKKDSLNAVLANGDSIKAVSAKKDTMNIDSLKKEPPKMDVAPVSPPPIKPDSVQRNAVEVKKDTLQQPELSPQNEAAKGKKKKPVLNPKLQE